MTDNYKISSFNFNVLRTYTFFTYINIKNMHLEHHLWTKKLQNLETCPWNKNI
jgi:hypothetical protein